MVEGSVIMGDAGGEESSHSEWAGDEGGEEGGV